MKSVRNWILKERKRNENARGGKREIIRQRKRGGSESEREYLLVKSTLFFIFFVDFISTSKRNSTDQPTDR